MNKGSNWMRLFVACLLAGSLALAGCSGDDGDMGPMGPVGPEGPAGPSGDPGAGLSIVPLESCGTCHGPGSVYNPNATGQAYAHNILQRGATTSVTEVTTTATTAVIKVNIKVDGVNRNDFGTVVAAASYTLGTAPGTGLGASTQNVYSNASATVVSDGNGNYTITATPPAAWVTDGVWTSTKDTTWMIRLNTGAGVDYPEANVVAHQTASGQHVRNLVGNAGCVQCHGNNIFKEQHASRVYHNSAYGSQSCVTCHAHTNRNNLMAYAHGIHNAHNMAERSVTSGTVTATKPAGVYARSSSSIGAPGGATSQNAAGNSWYETTYPTYMINCSVCHDSQERLDTVNAAPASWNLCMSCHDSWAGFGDHSGIFGGVNHNTFTSATNCAPCHNGSISQKVVAADFHNGQLTERSGLIWEGKDVSVTEGARIAQKFDSISRDGNNLVVKWSATLDGAAVNPCNTTVSATAPTWQSGFSILRGYGEGDDWTNIGIGTVPGQPVSTNIAFTGAAANTVCADNVATTTIALTANELATTATKGVVALQGKPQIRYTPANLTIAVRSKTPTFEYNVADPSQPVAARRAIVDTDACLKCHVGSLYQHGGNRIDNVDMCVLCHNEASNEQNVRINDGVDASEAYDGKAGQTYGFKSLLHAVHSANSSINQGITMVYRTNGIYVWAPESAVIPNWPGTGAQTVYGSNPAGTNPNGTTRNHNLHSPTYPRALNDCAACHKPNTYGVPDQAISMATTVNAGAAPWGNQKDDVLISTSTAACTSCHQASATRGHAYQNSWAPQTLQNGRQSIIDAAK